MFTYIGKPLLKDLPITWSEAYEDELNEFAGPGAAARLQKHTRDRWDSMELWREQLLKNLALVLKG